jgi:hypothetical protein
VEGLGFETYRVSTVQSYSRPHGESGRRLVSSEYYLSIAPVHNFSKFVHSACPGTHLHHFVHGQSEVALKDGRVQDVGLRVILVLVFMNQGP